MTDKMSQHLSIRFSPSEVAWLESAAARNRQTVSETLRQALQREMQGVSGEVTLSSRLEEIEKTLGRELQKMQNPDLKNYFSAVEARLENLEKTIDQLGNVLVCELDKVQRMGRR